MNTSRFSLVMLEAARGGDRDALLSLLAAAQPDIRRYARSSCHKADDIDDVVQETLWLLYRRVGTLRTLGSFSGWLFAVVRRECARMARKMFGLHLHLSAIEDDPRFAHRSQDELHTDLCRAIQSLPQHYREVILLRDLEEMSVGEISISLNLTRESVKARLHRARNMMREYLEA